jgi:hypothetical protein
MRPLFQIKEESSKPLRADGTTRGVPVRKVSAAEFYGEFYRLPQSRFAAENGWIVQRLLKKKVEIPLVFSNPAVGGSGVVYKIDSAKLTLDLASTELKVGQEYMCSMGDAWDNPFSKWNLPKPEGKSRREILEEQSRIQMDPILISEVIEATIKEARTGKVVHLIEPTGWVIGAGRFHRDARAR